MFIAIVFVLSVNIIAPLITCFERGFHLSDVLTVLPFIRLSAVVLVFIPYKPAGWLTARIVQKDDSFSAHVTANVVCMVCFTSLFLTVIGAWIGDGSLTMEPIQNFSLNGRAISPFPLSRSCGSGRPAGDDPPTPPAGQRPGTSSGSSVGGIGNRHAQRKKPFDGFCLIY